MWGTSQTLSSLELSSLETSPELRTATQRLRQAEPMQDSSKFEDQAWAVHAQKVSNCQRMPVQGWWLGPEELPSLATLQEGSHRCQESAFAPVHASLARAS